MSTPEHAPGRPSAPDAGGTRCPYPWCTTAHGRTSHPADEDHRSAGVPVTLGVRPPGDGRDSRVDAEVGLLRRQADADTWFVIDGGGALHLEITLGSARELVGAVLSDEALVAALELTPRLR